MFDRLPESKLAHARSASCTFTSILAHVVVIGAAAHFGERAIIAMFVRTQWICLMGTDAARGPGVPGEWRNPILHDRGAAVVGVPEVDALWPTVSTDPSVVLAEGSLVDDRLDAHDFEGVHECGVPAAAAQIREGETYFDFQVEQAAVALPDAPRPAYPATLRNAGVEGEALVQFVVDTAGLAEIDSFKVLRASHAAFGAPVRAAMPSVRFLPAETCGRRVRMLVQQVFDFRLNQ